MKAREALPILYVRDVARLEAFYRGGFGFGAADIYLALKPPNG